jgi:hypothetical protein
MAESNNIIEPKSEGVICDGTISLQGTMQLNRTPDEIIQEYPTIEKLEGGKYLIPWLVVNQRIKRVKQKISINNDKLRTLQFTKNLAPEDDVVIFHVKVKRKCQSEAQAKILKLVIKMRNRRRET